MSVQSFFKPYSKFFEQLIGQKQQINEDLEKAELSNIKKYALKCQLFLIRDDSAISRIFNESYMKTRSYEFNWEIKDSDSEIKKVIMKSKSSYQAEFQKDYFYFIISRNYKFILPIGYVQSKFLNKRIGTFFKEFFPDITTTFLSQSEIKQLISIYLDKELYRIELEVLVYRKAREKRKPKKKPIQKAIDYIGEDVISKISELEREKKYIETIGLLVINTKNNESARFYYNRYNRITWYYGLPLYLIELLDKNYILSINKFNLLDNRERRNTKNHESRPIVLKLNSSIFVDKERIYDFRNKIENFPNCNYALIHSGNPFMHIILRDQIDNSTYSIKNLSNRDLMICPQIIGSNSSILRILDLISKRISEFEILDYNQYKQEFLEL